MVDRMNDLDRNNMLYFEQNKAKHVELKTELRAINELKKELQVYNKRIEEYKAEMLRRIDSDVHLFSLQVSEIRKPQALMQQMCELNNKQLQEFSEKVSLRRSDLDVHSEKLELLTERINALENTRL
jgi:polyhydroxyalkanoate synthesis regulator phasin